MTKTPRANSRDRILAAAADVAQEAGPGALSLDAVAHRAGVSKGGLLYNFPTKAKLMQALVEDYLREFEEKLEAAAAANDGGQSLLALYICLSASECQGEPTSKSWIFSAIAEDPDFLTPIKTFRRQLFERLKAEAPDLKPVLVTYLAIEGLRSMDLFDSRMLSTREQELAVEALLEIAHAD